MSRAEIRETLVQISIEEGRADIETVESRMRERMRFIYDSWRRVSGDNLPKGIRRLSHRGLIVDPGSPRDPAIVLRANGEFVATQSGISRAANGFDPPITGLRYLEVANKTLDKLQRGIQAKKEAEKKN